MKRRQLLAGLMAGVAIPGTVLAQTAEDQVVDQLKRQGYRRISLSRTLLGRTRIVATGPGGRREIILNPSTGAILRDYVDRSDDDDRDDNDDDRDGGSGSSGDDRDDDDDDRDANQNDDRDDNSGRGSSDDDDDDDDDGDDDGDDDDDD